MHLIDICYVTGDDVSQVNEKWSTWAKLVLFLFFVVFQRKLYFCNICTDIAKDLLGFSFIKIFMSWMNESAGM